MFEGCVCVDWNAIDTNSFYFTIHRSVMYMELLQYVFQVINHFLLHISECCNIVQFVKNCISKMSYVITQSPSQIHCSGEKSLHLQARKLSVSLSLTLLQYPSTLKMEAIGSSKRVFKTTKGQVLQTVFSIVTAVRTSNPTKLKCFRNCYKILQNVPNTYIQMI